MIDKNKIEQAAKEYAEKSINKSFDKNGLNTSCFKIGFKAGVEFAEKEMGELAIRFLDSIRDYEKESHNLIGFDERSTEKLFEIFKEKDNERNKH